LKAITDVLVKYPHVWVMTDDMYEHLVYDDFVFTTPAHRAEMYDRTLTVNGVVESLLHDPAGASACRRGAELIKAMATIQSQSTSTRRRSRNGPRSRRSTVRRISFR